MRVSFLSMDDNHQKIAYQAEAILQENTYSFEDKSCEGTMIYLTASPEKVILERKGNSQMHMEFILDKLTKGFYKNEEGLEFDFSVKTQILKVEETKIKIRYAMLINEEVVSFLTIQFSFF